VVENVVNIYRGEAIESVHSGHFVAVNAEGRVLYKLGEPQTITYLRSCAKPFQAIAVVESGAAHRFKFTSEEIAIIAGSHSGEPEHVEVVSRILEKIGLGPQHLKCGIHVPHYFQARGIIPTADQQFTVLQHNCSGKHAGMLALCVFKDQPIDDYLNPRHPVQQLITETIAYICDYPIEKITIGVDGCSAPVHALPLYNMAYGFARFVSPHSIPRTKSKVYSTVYQAMLDHPRMVAGEKRYDTELMQKCREKLIVKGGAEALNCIGFIERGWGLAAKISDGATRAIYPFSVEILRQLGVITTGELEKLAEFHQKALYNWSNKEVGHIKAEFEIKKGDSPG